MTGLGRAGAGWWRVVLMLAAAFHVLGRTGRDAHAEVEAPIVAIDVANCPTAWDSEVRRAVAVELGDERLALHQPDRAVAKTLRVTCQEQAVAVVARDAATAATLERTFSPGELPAATAPRVVALAGVELLATLDPTLRRRRASASASGPRAPALAAPARVEGPTVAVTAGGVYRAFLSSGGIHAWGGTVDAQRTARSGRWLIGAGLELAGGDETTNIGRTSALLASVSAGAGMRVRALGDRPALTFALGGRGGAARLAGHSDDPTVRASTVIRPWAGPAATLRAELGVSRFCGQVTVEGGWAAIAPSGIVNEAPVLAATGPWLAIGLGVGLRR